ncbi:hypothetical protein Ciccas_005607 [Cichlidogyrus casuarinus]|uniref:Uncharacterized protein n=1 Tax=Cichlidogyrus casuarinus TaxID=1844966 RepID=A0ABD2Q8D7_9PLAT
MVINYFKVIADFCDSSYPKCLTVKQGDLLTLIDDSDVDWALVMKTHSSEQGYVPKSFMELIDLTDDRTTNEQEKRSFEFPSRSQSSSTTLSSLDQDIQSSLADPELDMSSNLYSGMSKRSALITEILETELTLHKEMSILMSVLQENQIQEKLPKAIYVELFSQIPQIELVSGKLCRNLQQLIESVSKEQREYLSIGEILLNEIDSIDRAYSLYVINFNARFFQLYSDQKDVFAIIEEAFDNHANNPKNTLGLSSVLMKPFHRISRYPILIESLLKTTAPNTPDFDNLQEFLSKIQGILNESNERRRYKEACEDSGKNYNIKSIKRRAISLLPKQITMHTKIHDENDEHVNKELAALKLLKQRTKSSINWLKVRLEHTKQLVTSQSVFLNSLAKLIAESSTKVDPRLVEYMEKFAIFTSEDLLNLFSDKYLTEHNNVIIPQLEKLFKRVKAVSKVTNKIEELKEQLSDAKKALKAASSPSPLLVTRKKDATTALECFKMNLAGELEVLQTSGFALLRVLMRKHFLLNCELYDKVVEPQNNIIEHLCEKSTYHGTSRTATKLHQIDQRRLIFCNKIDNFIKRFDLVCKMSGKGNLNARLTKNQPLGSKDTKCAVFIPDSSTPLFLGYSMTSICSNTHRPPNIAGPVTNVVIGMKCNQDTEDLATMLDYVENVDKNAKLFRLTRNTEAEALNQASLSRASKRVFTVESITPEALQILVPKVFVCWDSC